MPTDSSAGSPALSAETLAGVREWLSGRFQGEILATDSPGYEDARQVWNGMVATRPALILRCTSRADVVAAVQAAGEFGVHPAVRGGGHSVSGRALVEGGITIDLSGLSNVVVDEANRLVHVDGGCLLGDVDAATAPAGLVVPAGTVSETGVGGLALGGGIGWVARKFGLTCDQFVSIELVLASGEVVEVTAESHPDLFWALRGGGGNFGIVTRFTLRAHEFGPSVRMGVSLYEAKDAAEALNEYVRVLPTLSRDVGFHGVLKDRTGDAPFVPADLVGERLLMLFSIWLGDPDDPAGVAELEALCALGSPRTSTTVVVPFGAWLQKSIDVDFPSGMRYYTNEAHVEGVLSPEAIDTIVDFWRESPMPGGVQFIQAGGAIADVPEADTAFSNRGHLLWLMFASKWDDPADDADFIARTKAIRAELAPWLGSGIYLNMLNFDEMDRVVDALGGPEKFERIREVKAKYDPDNFFRVNYNVPPAVTTA